MKHSFLPGPNFGPKAVELQHIVSENNLRNFVVFYKLYIFKKEMLKTDLNKHVFVLKQNFFILNSIE